MVLGHFNVSNNYRNYSLLELVEIACDEDNDLAMSIINKFDEHVENESFRIRDEVISDIKEFDIFDMMKLLNEYDGYEIIWNHEIESFNGYKVETYYLNDFNENHYENHNIRIERKNYSSDVKGVFMLRVNHDVLGEYYYELPLESKVATKAQKEAIDILKKQLASNNLNVYIP